MAAKQKRAKELSINDMVGERKNSSGEPKKFFGAILKIDGKDNNGSLEFNAPEPTALNKPGIRKVEPLINTKALLEQEEKTNKYNENIQNLSEKYTKLIPLHKVIVRCKLLETERTDKGLIIPPTVKVTIPTNNGIGRIGEVDSPFPYSREAVIVSAPPHFENDEDHPIKRGKMCVLAESPIKASSAGKDALITLPNGFTHPEWKSLQLPKDFSHEHFGYLMVSFRDIEIILD